MAGKRIIVPNFMPATDRNGFRVPGARLFFYENQTTTPKPVYTAADLLTPLPNPVVANSAGVFPSIFADEEELFTVALTDAAGAPLSGLKNLNFVAPSVSAVTAEELDDAVTAITEAEAAALLAVGEAAEIANTARDLAQQYSADAAAVSGVNVPIYAGIASAEGATIAAGVKSIRVQYRSPSYADLSTLIGGGDFTRMSKADIDAAGYPTLAWFRSTDRFMPDGSTDATNGGYWLLNVPVIDVAMLGAKGDDSTDDATALQAAFDFGAALNRPVRGGGSGRGYKIASTVTLPQALDFDGDGCEIHYTGSTVALRVLGSRYTLRRFTLKGDSALTYTNGHRGIYGCSTTFSPTNVVWHDDITIDDVTVHGFGDIGVRLDWTRGFRSRNLTVHNCGYAGVLLLSALDFNIEKPTIHTIGPGTGGTMYGIAFSRSYSSPALDTTDAPRSWGVLRDPLIYDIPDYVAIDTHGGHNIRILGPRTRNCRIAVNLEHATGGGSSVSVDAIVIDDFDFEGVDPVTHNVGPAIAVDAQSGAGEIATGVTIGAGTVWRHGFTTTFGSNSFTEGGVFLIRNATGVSVGRVTVREPHKRVFWVGQNTRGLAINGVTAEGMVRVGSVCRFLELANATAQAAMDGCTMNGPGEFAKATTPSAGYGLIYGANNVQTPELISVTSIERSSTTATVTTATPHGVTVGETFQVMISGATETDYNGQFTATATGDSEFTYTVSGSPSTPATGTIVANLAVRMDAATKSVVKWGSGVMVPRLKLQWDSTGAVIWDAYQDLGVSVAMSKTSTGIYVITLPRGMFNNARVNATAGCQGGVAVCNDASNTRVEVRTYATGTTTLTDFSDNWLEVSGR